MLMKLMTDHGDFERALRRRRMLSIGLLVLGLLGLVCYFTLVKDSDALPDMARGFYLGVSTAFIIWGLGFLFKNQHLLTHPQARRKAKIEETDERTKTITSMAFQTAGLITMFLCAAAMFVLVAVNRPAALTLFFVIIAYAAVMFCSHAYYSQKL